MPSFAPRVGVLLATCSVVLAVLLTPVRASADTSDTSEARDAGPSRSTAPEVLGRAGPG